MTTHFARGARRRAYAVIAVAVALLVARQSRGGAEMRALDTCDRAEYRQFDFFIGEWDTYDVGSSTIKAHNSVTRMLDGCVIREVYRRTDGYTGESFSTYDVARGAWHQSWVTNRGELLLLDGGMKDGHMVLSGNGPVVHGKPSLIRGTWLPGRDGSVRETAEQSTDGGKTWSPLFDIVFRRRTR